MAGRGLGTGVLSPLPLGVGEAGGATVLFPALPDLIDHSVPIPVTPGPLTFPREEYESMFIAGALMSGTIKLVWDLGAFFVPAPSPSNIKLALDLVKPSSIYDTPTVY